MVQAIPDVYSAVTPYMIIRGAASAIEFYKKVFDAKEFERMEMEGGAIGHAEIEIGGARIMLADENPDGGFTSPQTLGGNAMFLVVYVEKVDEVFKGAIAAGCREIRPLENQFYGDRSGTLVDPFGHMWTIATHVEDVSREEMERRLRAMGDGS